MNETYNYYDALYNDIKNNLSEYRKPKDFVNREEYEEYLNDIMIMDDAITGNGSNSYTFNAYKAKGYVLQNIELAAKACVEYGIDLGESIEEDKWEEIDVSIRCYLLNETICKVLDDIENEVGIKYCVND